MDDLIELDKKKNCRLEKVIDTACQYDIYFAGGKNSIYNKRFGSAKFISREVSTIKSAYKIAMQGLKSELVKEINNFEFRILDFGCGDGRLFPIVEEIAASNRSVNFVVIAYDLSQVALQCFDESLKHKSYLEETEDHKVNENVESLGYISKSLTKANITVKFVHGYSTDTLDYTEQLIRSGIGGDIHLNLCMFGTISHVAGRQNRQNILKMFSQLSHPAGKIVISVPAIRMFAKELAAFDLLRKHHALAKQYNLKEYSKVLNPYVDLAKEDGDLYYLRYNDNSALINYSHVFSMEEFAQDLQLSALSFTDIQVLSITYVPNLTVKPWFLRCLDSFASYILSLNLIPYTWSAKFVDQYITIASPIK